MVTCNAVTTLRSFPYNALPFMTNKKLLYLGFVAKTWIIVVITCGSLVSTLTCLGQSFVNDWEVNHGGSQWKPTRSMTVNVDNGDSYAIQRESLFPLSATWSVMKYNKNGHLVWQVPYVVSDDEFVFARSLVYKNGAVFVIGTIGGDHHHYPAASHNRAVVIKFIDAGDSGIQSWSRQFVLIDSGPCQVNAIVSDPVGSGVIFTGRALGATTPNHVEMRTVKIDGDEGNTIWANTYDLGVDMTPHPEPIMIATDRAGNTYVTGASGDLPTEPDYLGPTSLFVIKYNSAGDFQWINKLTEPGYSNYGYDIEADDTGVYVLGQKMYSGSISTLGIRGFVTLTKFDLTGTVEPVWNIQIPCRFRDGTIEREVLAVDPVGSSVYIAYDNEDEDIVNVEKYSADGGILQWTRETERYERVRSLNFDGNGTVILGVNKAPASSALYAYTETGDPIDQITLTTYTLGDMIVDNDHRIHLKGSRSLPGSNPNFVSQFSFTEPDPLFDLVRQFERLEVDLYRHGYEECWTGFNINWNCFRRPFCSDPQLYAEMFYEDKLVWESKFTKPLDAQLPKTQNFRTFSLQVMDGQNYSEVLHIDDNLAKAGVSQISFKTDAKELSLSLQMETNGVELPVTISFLNNKGAVIREEKFTAPFTAIFSDKLAEQVASISLTGLEVMSLSYYPNPSSGQFKVSIDKAIKLPAELSIYDMQGLKIYNDILTTHEASVVLSNPKVGLHILQLKSDQAIRRDLIQIK